MRRILAILGVLVASCVLLFGAGAAAGAQTTRSDATIISTHEITRGATSAAAAAITGVRDLGDGAWTYFGDPRSVSHGPFIFTGWIAEDHWVMMERFNRFTGESKTYRLFQNAEMDDHDNPITGLLPRQVVRVR